jgi:phosphoglycolate phosphatase
MLIKKRGLFWGIVTNKPENLTQLLLNKLDIKPDVVALQCVSNIKVDY